MSQLSLTQQTYILIFTKLFYFVSPRMCGIFLSEIPPSETLSKRIKARGHLSSSEIRVNNITMLSSVLPIRSVVSQPVQIFSLYLQYNGEIYDSYLSDTEHISEIIKKCYIAPSNNGAVEDVIGSEEYVNGRIIQAYETVRPEINDAFHFIESVYLEINKSENELALSIYSTKQRVYFFKDDIGRRSLGFTLKPFTLSSVDYSTEIDPMKLYIYDFNSNKLFSKFKPSVDLVRSYLMKTKGILSYFKKYEREHNYLFGYDRIVNGLPTTMKQKSENHLKSINESVSKNHSIIKDNLLNEDALFTSHFIGLFSDSVKRRIPFENDDPVIFFSGGVDSTLLALFVHLNMPANRPIYLINTSFPSSFDRKIGLQSYEELSKRFPERHFLFVENDLQMDRIKEEKEQIMELIHPKTGKMDFNIGTVHYFSSLIAKRYGKVVFLGSGADEVFGGYNKYKEYPPRVDEKEMRGCNGHLEDSKISLLEFNASETRNHMFFDLFTISAHNLCRDDRVIANQGLEARLPFLDSGLIEFSIYSPDHLFIRNGPDGIENKYLLRMVLREFGLSGSSSIPKKAMQYGTGIQKHEKELLN